MNPFDKLRYIEIETHSSCTRACTWCLFGSYPELRPAEQAFLESEHIIDMLSDLMENGFRGAIGLFSINEPLLDPRVADGSLIRKCREIVKHNILLTMTTNGDLLSRELADHLFLSGLDIIKISCYEKPRYEEMRLKFKDYPRVIVLDQTRYNEGKYESNRGGSLPSFRASVQEYHSCFLPQYRLAIGWNGEVRVCYNDILQNIKTGNVKKAKLSDIINSEHYRNIVYSIQHSRQSVYPCSVCNVCGNENKFLESNRIILKALVDIHGKNE